MRAIAPDTAFVVVSADDFARTVESWKGTPLNAFLQTDAMRKVMHRYAPDGVVDSCFASHVQALVEHGVTGIICDSTATAQQVLAALEKANVRVPGQVSVAAVGISAETSSISSSKPGPCWADSG